MSAGRIRVAICGGAPLAADDVVHAVHELERDPLPHFLRHVPQVALVAARQDDVPDAGAVRGQHLLLPDTEVDEARDLVRAGLRQPADRLGGILLVADQGAGGAVALVGPLQQELDVLLGRVVEVGGEAGGRAQPERPAAAQHALSWTGYLPARRQEQDHGQPGRQLFLAANNTAVMTGTQDADKGLLSGLLGLSRNLGFMAGASLAPWTFAFMLDGHGVAGSSSQAIGEAFTGTFAAAAGLCVLAIVLALLGQGGRRGPSPQ